MRNCFYLIPVYFFCLLVVIAGPVSAKNIIVKTKHTELTFNSAEDMAKFNRQIKFGSSGSFSSMFKSSDINAVQKDLTRKIDSIYEKVQLILDMRKAMKPVHIRVYSNSGELKQAFEKIFKAKCTVRGWYTYEYNTIFMNAEDVHEGMLAHEMGHSIIDHYLDARPPRATAEILARYVDAHLKDEAKQY